MSEIKDNSEYRKEYYKLNAEKIKEKNLERYKKNREEYLKTMQKYYSDHSDSIKERVSNYKKTYCRPKVSHRKTYQYSLCEVCGQNIRESFKSRHLNSIECKKVASGYIKIDLCKCMKTDRTGGYMFGD